MELRTGLIALVILALSLAAVRLTGAYALSWVWVLMPIWLPCLAFVASTMWVIAGTIDDI